MKKFYELKNLILLFLGWRIWVTLGMIFGLVLPVQMTFLGGGAKNYYVSPLTWSWANFDGAHYLSIASFGYRQFEQAFFPLYPLLISSLEKLTQGEYVYLGLLISNVSFLGSLIIFYKLLKFDKVKNSFWIIAFFLFFPTSFYFAGVYTESLFLLLILVSFFAARKKMWWLAGLSGALASATRIVGVLLLPALLVEYYSTSKKDKFSWLWLLLIPVGLLGYMFWLEKTTGDPLMFFHSQTAFSAGRGLKFILLPQVIFRYLRIFFTIGFNYQYIISASEFIVSLGIITLLIYGINKRRWSYWVFVFFSFLVPALTGTFLSMPRFIITMFPLFFLLPQIFSTLRSRVILLGFFLLLMFMATMFFTRGYWIA